MRHAWIVLLLAACSTTTGDVQSGEAWANARPSDYPASHDEVVASITSFCSARDFQMAWDADQALVKAYRRGDDIGEQSIELHVRVEPAPAAGYTRVTAISGRSAGIQWKGRYVHERLHKQLRADFPPR